MRKMKVDFISNDQKIAGTLLIPKIKTKKLLPGVVFYHGYGSSQRGYISRAETVVKKGTTCLTFDFRGRGESEGDFSYLTITDGIKDALSAFDFLKKQKQIDKNRLAVCGRSFGGYLAAIISGKRNVKSLVLSAPAIYKNSWLNLIPKKVSLKEVKRFRKSNDFSNTQAIRAIREYKGSLLVIINEKDETIPERVVRAYYDNAVNAKKRKIAFIKKAGHRLDKPEFDEEFKRLISDWFVETL